MSSQAHDMKDADDAPTFGQNGRDIILQAARELELKGAAKKSASLPQPAATPPPDFDDSMYYAAVPSASRPSIAFDPRAKIPRVIRQAGLTRLVAQHLRLAARCMPHSQKLAFAGQEKVWKAAIDAAKSQELALHQRAATRQVYQNLLARTKASDYHAPAAAQVKQQSTPAPTDASAPTEQLPAELAPPSGAAEHSHLSEAAPPGQPPDKIQPPAGKADVMASSSPVAAAGSAEQQLKTANSGASPAPEQHASVKRKHSEIEEAEAAAT